LHDVFPNESSATPVSVHFRVCLVRVEISSIRAKSLLAKSLLAVEPFSLEHHVGMRLVVLWLEC
jgi:hypothetical protein